MKWTGLNELRESYLSFFESKGHLRLPSFSLIPQNDNSLLLINSGMAPMKPYFQGTKEPPRRRVTTCQKCIRTPDLDNVGKTARHGTYFEMLGNFSFGDYFKKEAIEWSWEYFTKVLEIPEDRLWPSVYENDEEAYNFWKQYVPEERIVKLGKADNFWEHGSGPCGPCSEIYFDRGEKYGCGSPDCKPGCECDRYMEIWNNVFSQFDNDGKGNYTELVQKNIDTGMGLERLACVMQGVDNLFEVDTVRKILDTVCEYSGKKYGENYNNDVSIRIITDHIRSSTFMICDGVKPSNEGRGYVLRRILRRAARNGRLLGIKGAFLAKLSDVVISQNENAYPELSAKKDYIAKVISIEEERFDATIDTGLSLLSKIIEEAGAKGVKVISGEDTFKLYDTYGFPFDLTKEIIADAGFEADEEEFKKLMNEQKKLARENRKDNGGWSKDDVDLFENIAETVFTGYTETESDAEVMAVASEGMLVDELCDGEGIVVLDKTPFYGEGGGQVGDTGKICGDGFEAEVVDTKKANGKYMHIVNVLSGNIKAGMKVKAAIDTEKREAIRRNHSTVHLLQAALRKVLGDHVEQAGSYVDAERFRFDFSHFEPMTKEQIAQVEALVNNWILSGTEIENFETDIESAKKMGAMALFGEKYGNTVRVVKMGEFSTELCGGTHMTNTAKAGLCKILYESSVAAGVRRIEGITGENVLSYIYENLAVMQEAAKNLKAQNISDIADKAAAVSGEVKELKSKIEELSAEIAKSKTSSLTDNAQQVGAYKLVTARLDGMSGDELRAAGDILKDSDENIVAVLGSVTDGKVTLLAVCGKAAVKNGAHAGKIIKETAAIVGGGGGGRPDSAQAGGKDATKLDDALANVKNLLA
ncbi:MAG: alanine--tRNA ligase [Ruminococcaceae bacterium]|nr:alanine--tRNA ligase [Oscillospiraceae bacterium]